MARSERQRAYRADVTYLTAKEAGFDFLRDGLVFETEELVHRPFHFALVDEADSILIDEARIPLVIAGDAGESSAGPERLATLVRRLRPGIDFDTDEYAHNISLTEAGAARVEGLLTCGDLYTAANLSLHAQLRNALHAEYLLRRDVDYIVRSGRIELVDDFTGRVAEKRQWPDGLQAAIEAKEGVRLQAEGRILGSITLQHFLRLYPKLSGMTATAHSATDELEQFYGLSIATIPTHRPMIRVEHPDVVFTHQDAKREALVAEIVGVHATGRPVLVGTESVAESERLAESLRERGVACQVLNAKNDEVEAQIIARAGALGAVTISTNMAGRGTDIRLGGPEESQRDAVVGLGGLYVIGTNRHSSLRIDNQLRGRAGRQGDPGGSRFFVSLQDDLIERYGVGNLISARYLPPRQDGPIESRLVRAEIARAQRIIEGESFEIRKSLYAYSDLVERQRQAIQRWRQDVLYHTAPLDRLAERCAERYQVLAATVETPLLRSIERRLTLAVIDRCWSEYLAEVREMREDSCLVAFAGQMPLAEFHRTVGRAFLALEERIEDEIVRSFEALEITADGVDWEKAGLRGPSATWTYLVGENPFNASALATPYHRTANIFAMLLYGPLFLIPAIALMWKRHKARKARRMTES